MRPDGVQAGDAELIERARAGDREAFGDLVRRYQDTVHTLAVRLVGRDLAPDVAQEAFLRAWRALPGFRGEAAFSTWLHRITVNAAWTLRRRARRVEVEPIAEDLPDSGLSPEQAGEAADARRRVQAALEGLSPALRAVVVLRDVYGWDGAETARELGISVVAVKVRLHRARLRLRTLLEER